MISYYCPLASMNSGNRRPLSTDDIAAYTGKTVILTLETPGNIVTNITGFITRVAPEIGSVIIIDPSNTVQHIPLSLISKITLAPGGGGFGSSTGGFGGIDGGSGTSSFGGFGIGRSYTLEQLSTLVGQPVIIILGDSPIHGNAVIKNINYITGMVDVQFFSGGEFLAGTIPYTSITSIKPVLSGGVGPGGGFGSSTSGFGS